MYGRNKIRNSSFSIPFAGVGFNRMLLHQVQRRSLETFGFDAAAFFRSRDESDFDCSEGPRLE